MELTEAVRRTVLVESMRLEQRLGVRLILATETFQRTGSFKFRAAYNVALKVEQTELIASSSGNFGQALAYACRLLGKSCTIVMPESSAQVKIDAVREHGGRIELIDLARTSRKERVMELARKNPGAYVASAYDDPFVIEGNATLGKELAELRDLDCVIAPVGGGGLISGIIQGLRQNGSRTQIFGAEPLLGNDAARSLRAGQIVSNAGEPETIADGARTTSIGVRNWEVMRGELSDIIEVPEERIIDGVQLLSSLANLKAEPTGALSVGAILTEPERFRGKKICCVISGGNVDPAFYREILGHSPGINR